MIKIFSIAVLFLLVNTPVHALLYTYNKGTIDLSTIKFEANTGNANPITFRYQSAYAVARSNTNGNEVNNALSTYVQPSWMPVGAVADDTQSVFTPGTELSYECYSLTDEHQLYNAWRVAGVVLGGAFDSNFTGDLTISFDYTWQSVINSSLVGQRAYTTFRPYVVIRYPTGSDIYLNSFGINVLGIGSEDIMRTGHASLTVPFIEGQFGTFELGIDGDTNAIDPVPEPSTMFLLGGGFAGLAFWRKRKLENR